MFGPAKSSKLARIVCLETRKCARDSAKRLEREFRSRKTRPAKVRVKRATVLAANRADTMAGNRRLKPATRKSKAGIAKTYRGAAKRMKLPK